jgi:arginine/ornithine N-succinyltransferase beta subunit
MARPTVRIHNTQIDEVIDREMNDVEFAQYEIDQANYLTKETEAKARVEAKAAALAKLEALGLTVEDLQALGL